MAVNDVAWVEGQTRLIKSSGTEASVFWLDGQSVVIHEATVPTGGVMADWYYRTLLQGSM